VLGGVLEKMLEGASPYIVVLAFTAMSATIANFISSTVASVLLMPIIVQVGEAIGEQQILVMLCAVMISGACASV
jgi:di/tricarboxylate transporter